MIRSLASLTVLAAFLLACSQLRTEPKKTYPSISVDAPLNHNLDETCVANFRDDVDYFPERTTFRHSNQLSVEYHRHFKRVTFRPSVSAEEKVELLLVQCGTPVPAHADTSIVVSVPVSRIATASRAMLGAADEIGVVERFVGISDPRAVTVPAFKKRVEAGAIAPMSGHAHGNIEPIMGADPDVYFTFHSAYPQFNIHPKLWALGVRAIPHGDSLEATPLGRAEWMKLLAMLTNREARGEEAFDRIERNYQAVLSIIGEVVDRPAVLAGTASQRDVMELFGGANHRAALLRDAGGRFVLERNRFTGSWLITPFEQVYAAGADAPFWIGTRPGIRSVDALIAANANHRWFETAIARDSVYALDLGYRGMFAYHLEDQGLNNPHRQLLEIASILHPEFAERLRALEPAALFLRKLQ